ncbi:hypothetical protein PTTG_26124 [Puccinia triticina 1-1 BBBD Race 1]|uniref:MSP domain-containing protein n=2 Tax=Puccinia triticina TaxID=208348 RepID=A0A180GXQ2_PUCT1|nr:uncharacterized protein PtA15_17A139 [Puccinia triticina]OAV97314.1 hypothetical protein PTTG_26124 [Puccinia triticina 1-1 BBBD Race 1]WAQ92657.1 hypothetical protein PtA15_17A139 [Puccinia triticina]WAR63552.1 hypothetical protein PtB15_17B152 [Puccinia triticina]
MRSIIRRWLISTLLLVAWVDAVLRKIRNTVTEHEYFLITLGHQLTPPEQAISKIIPFKVYTSDPKSNPFGKYCAVANTSARAIYVTTGFAPQKDDMQIPPGNQHVFRCFLKKPQGQTFRPDFEDDYYIIVTSHPEAKVDNQIWKHIMRDIILIDERPPNAFRLFEVVPLPFPKKEESESGSPTIELTVHGPLDSKKIQK